MDDAIDIQKAIKSLKEMIPESVEDSVLEEEIDVYRKKHRMKIDACIRAVMKDHGGTDDDYISHEIPNTTIAELQPGLRCNIVARVKGCTFKNNLCKISVEDNTGTTTVIVWNQNPDLIRNKVYKFKNIKAKYSNYSGTIELESHAGKTIEQ